MTGFVPTWIGQVAVAADGSAPDQVVPARAGAPYGRARLLLRAGERPLALEDFPVEGGRVSGARIQAAAVAAGVAEQRPATVVSLPTRRVSVIVCTRDREDSLRTALTSVLASDWPDLELVVVDNAPRTSATRDVVAGLADPRVRYVLEPRPGLSVARNRGVAEATGDILAFTDDDVIADPNWVKAIASGFARSASVGCVTGLVPAAELETPAQAYFDAKVQWAASCAPALYDLHEHRGAHFLYPYSAGIFGTGANFALTRAAAAAVGTFDEALGAGAPAAGGEDLDYFLRVVLAGYALAYEPAAIVWHVHRRETEALVHQMYGYGAGLGAYVFKQLTTPRTAAGMLRRLPRGAVRFAKVSREGQQATQAPQGALERELRGLVAGPAAYLRGRRQVRAGLRSMNKKGLQPA
jgi:glycosyltransferase involved in cell wall biosynthesis